jgi:hypothetical protein
VGCAQTYGGGFVTILVHSKVRRQTPTCPVAQGLANEEGKVAASYFIIAK